MNSRIHYIGNYKTAGTERKLNIYPSAITKMSYIISTLKKLNFNVVVYSPAEARSSSFVYYKGKREKVDEREEIVYINSFNSSNVLVRSLSRLWMMIQLLAYLLFEVKKDEVVLVYHVYIFKWPIKIARAIKKFNLFFEVEEIFNAAWEKSEDKISKEIEYLKNARGYILVNDIIAAKCGFSRPFVVCYGSYKTIPVSNKKFSDGKIHLIYAGIIGDKQGDSSLAIETMKFLPANFVLHLMGYGTEENISYMCKLMNESNKFKNIIYHGCLDGEIYYNLLSQGHIGLCTRVLNNKMSDYTFPSKLLVYLSAGLTPLCSPIDCVLKSQLKNYIIFSEDVTAEKMAAAIRSMDLFSIRNKGTLQELDSRFCQELTNLLGQ